VRRFKLLGAHAAELARFAQSASDCISAVHRVSLGDRTCQPVIAADVGMPFGPLARFRVKRSIASITVLPFLGFLTAERCDGSDALPDGLGRGPAGRISVSSHPEMYRVEGLRPG